MEHKSTSMLQLPEKEKKDGCNGRLGLAIFGASVGMFQFGYNTTVINAPADTIKSFYNESHVSRYGFPMADITMTVLWSVTVAITAAGGCIGGVLGAPYADALGRKKGMLVNTVFGVVGTVLMACSKFGRSYEMLIIGRFIIGFHCGLYTGLAPLYNAEVSPSRIRGAIGTINQLAVTIGLLIAQVLGLSEVLGTERWWPLLLGLAGVAPILQLLTLPFCPESPRYLLLSKGQESEAIEALQILRNSSAVDDEINEMRREQEQSAMNDEEKVKMCQLCDYPNLRHPLGLAILMHLSQQFSGINVIFYYSTTLFASVGLSGDTPKYVSLAVGGIMVIMTLVSIPLMDRAGRRTLHLTGLGGMVVFSTAFTITYHFALKPDTSNFALQVTSVVLALVFVVFFAIGPGSIPWMIVSEFFSQGPRPSAVAVSVLINWLANMAVGLAFPYMQENMNELVFVPFTGLTFLFFILLCVYLPETKGRTFDEISALFAKQAKIGNTSSTKDYGTKTYDTQF